VVVLGLLAALAAAALCGCPTTRTYGPTGAMPEPRPTIRHIYGLRQNVAAVIEAARVREDTAVLEALLPVQEFLGVARPADEVEHLARENRRLSAQNREYEERLAEWKEGVAAMGTRPGLIGVTPTGGAFRSLLSGVGNSLLIVALIAVGIFLFGGAAVRLWMGRKLRLAGTAAGEAIGASSAAVSALVSAIGAHRKEQKSNGGTPDLDGKLHAALDANPTALAVVDAARAKAKV